MEVGQFGELGSATDCRKYPTRGSARVRYLGTGVTNTVRFRRSTSGSSDIGSRALPGLFILSRGEAIKMSRNHFSLTFALLALPSSAFANDSITCPPSSDSQNATCIVVPESDGVFNFEIIVTAHSNTSGRLTTEIKLDSGPCATHKEVAFKGDGRATDICSRKLKAGSSVTVTGIGTNSNAESPTLHLSATRAQ